MALPTASDNPFASLLITEGSAPSSPAAGKRRLYVLSSDHLAYLKDSSGTVVALTIGGYVPGGTDVPIADGGTGQSTKAAGFDALSPMSASGDMLYGGTSGTGTRLPKGSNGQVLTLAAGLPSWAAGGGGGSTPTILLNYTESGNISVTGMSATTWTDVLANQNFTVASATSLIEIAVRGHAIPNIAAQSQIGSRVVIDSAGTPINENLGAFFFNTNTGNYFAGSGSIFISGLTAAVHTIKLQAYSTVGANQFLCRTASTPPEFLRVQIIEHL